MFIFFDLERFLFFFLFFGEKTLVIKVKNTLLSLSLCLCVPERALIGWLLLARAFAAEEGEKKEN